MSKTGRVTWLLFWNIAVMPIGCVLDFLRAPQWIATYREEGNSTRSAFVRGCKEIGAEYADSLKNLVNVIKS